MSYAHGEGGGECLIYNSDMKQSESGFQYMHALSGVDDPTVFRN